MKNLKTYLEDLFVVPANTTGMGSVASPSMNNVTFGSGDIPAYGKLRPIKKIKKRKNEVSKRIHNS